MTNNVFLNFLSASNKRKLNPLAPRLYTPLRPLPSSVSLLLLLPAFLVVIDHIPIFLTFQINNVVNALHQWDIDLNYWLILQINLQRSTSKLALSFALPCILFLDSLIVFFSYELVSLTANIASSPKSKQTSNHLLILHLSLCHPAIPFLLFPSQSKSATIQTRRKSIVLCLLQIALIGVPYGLGSALVVHNEIQSFQS